MKILFVLVLLIGVTAAILNLGRLAKKPPFSVSSLEYINIQLTYQALLLGLALLVLIVLYFVDQANLLSFFALGNVSAPAEGVVWLGISDNESWLGLGTSLMFFITLATSTFVYLQFRKSGASLKQLLPFLPWVLLFSLSNAFSEEVVYRLGVVVPLAGTIDAGDILLISAITFGVPHLRGMPNGIVGALMAGLLGWLLAKSVVETNGIFWAWFIHFLQDIVIFSAFVMASASKSLDRLKTA